MRHLARNQFVSHPANVLLAGLLLRPARKH
jgi:hypothetical protein